MDPFDDNDGVLLYTESGQSTPISFNGYEFRVPRNFALSFRRYDTVLEAATRFCSRRVWLRCIFSWPLVNVFDSRLIAYAERFVDLDGNPNVQRDTPTRLLTAEPTFVTEGNVSSTMPNSVSMERFLDITHTNEVLDVRPLQVNLDTVLDGLLGNEQNLQELRYLIDGFFADSVRTFFLESTATCFFDSDEERVKYLIERTIMDPSVRFIKGVAQLHYGKNYDLEVSGGSEFYMHVLPLAPWYRTDTGMGLFFFGGRVGGTLLFFNEVKPYTKKVGWGYLFYMYRHDDTYLPPELDRAVDRGSQTYHSLKRKCIEKYLLTFMQMYLYALLHGVEYFGLSDYSCQIFYRVIREYPQQPRLEEVKVQSRYTSYRDEGSDSVRNILAAILWATVPPPNADLENPEKWCKAMFAALLKSKEELRQLSRNRHQQILKTIEQTTEPGEIRDTVVKNYQNPAFLELHYNEIEDLKVGPGSLIQTYRVRSTIIAEPLSQDTSYIFKLFAYKSCNRLFEYFETFIAPEKLEKVEAIEHISEIRTYVTLQSLQGICIPRLVHYGSMFDYSEVHKFSILQGPYLLMQDVGDVEPDFGSLEHYRLALSAVKRMHQLGIVHRDLHLRNMRLYENRIFIFDFNLSRVARDKNDYERDLADLRLAFKRALLNVDSEDHGVSQDIPLGDNLGNGYAAANSVGNDLDSWIVL